MAILFAVVSRNVDFALDAADNKLALMVTIAVTDLHDLAHGDLRRLGKSEILKHLQVVMEALGKSALDMSGPADDWISDRMNNWLLRQDAELHV
jgi:hypothetical protein